MHLKLRAQSQLAHLIWDGGSNKFPGRLYEERLNEVQFLPVSS